MGKSKRPGQEAFLETYFTAHPSQLHENLPFFMASALFLGFDRLLYGPKEKWEPKIDALLEQCEKTLQMKA
jgi:hypothetical protein